MCVHPTRVEVDRGGDVCEIDAFGVGFATRPRRYRGVVTTQECACENGHRFVIRQQFHKGSTYLSVDRLPGVRLDPDAQAWPATIWRD